MEEDEKKYYGFAVFESKGALDLVIRNTRGGDLDHVIVESKHRHDFFRDKGGKWKYKFRYHPKAESGLVKIKGFDDKGRHSYGAFIIADGTQKLRGNLYCNGSFYLGKTVTGCQSKETLSQLIEFIEDVTLVQDDLKAKCAIRAPRIFRELEFDMGKGHCTYTFIGIHSGYEHKMWTYGHEMHMIPTGK
jgi:hypothetical protein